MIPEIAISFSFASPLANGEISVTGYLRDRIKLIDQAVEARNHLLEKVDDDTTRDF